MQRLSNSDPVNVRTDSNRKTCKNFCVCLSLIAKLSVIAHRKSKSTTKNELNVVLSTLLLKRLELAQTTNKCPKSTGENRGLKKHIFPSPRHSAMQLTTTGQ